MKILVVDDFSTMRRILKNLLNSLGYSNIEMASDGTEAVKILNSDQNFDLIITDWNMPHMTGLELLRHIRSTFDTKHIPVLMVTAEAKKEKIIEAAKAGVNGYIVKPFPGETLKNKIDAIFARI